jgi:hypothetical protein
VSVDLSGEITAIATVVLAVGAIITGILAYLAFRTQAQEVSILQQQVKEQQEAAARQAAERREAQAARVFIRARSENQQTYRPYAVNASGFPVYDARLWCLDRQGCSHADYGDDLGAILPGHEAIATHFDSLSSTEALTNTALTFRDAAGARWMRLPGGALEEQSGATVADSILARFGKPPP